MGLVLDSSVLIAAEREKRSVSRLLSSLEANYSETQFLLSSITVMELEHGWHRANSPEAALKRRVYLDEVFAVISVEPFTREMGVLAAKIDAGIRKGGLVLATADLLIGVTALYHAYATGTRNVRHFQMIPGLNVIPL
ncbi:MAG: PIN domain-containing protein [Bryobacteraceae bacterium]